MGLSRYLAKLGGLIGSDGKLLGGGIQDGLGYGNPKILAGTTNLNTITARGVYMGAALVNSPDTANWVHLLVSGNGSDQIQQRARQAVYATGQEWLRESTNGGTTWSAWVKIGGNYTPINKAGDAMNGALNMQANEFQLAGAKRLQYRAFPYNGGGYEVATEQPFVETASIVYGKDYEIAVNIGIGGVDTRYWYVQFPTGMNFVGSIIVEAFAGGWNYGQVSGYARWHVRMINGTVSVVAIEDSNSNLTCTAKAYNHNTGSNMYHRVALYNNVGRNGFWVRLRSSADLFTWGTPNTAITNTNPTA